MATERVTNALRPDDPDRRANLGAVQTRKGKQNSRLTAGKTFGTRGRPREKRRLSDLVITDVSAGTLRQLRDLLGLTQVELAAQVAASQAQLSAIEKRDDRLVSTMAEYVEALGGKLRLQAVFEGGKVLEISGSRP